MADTPIPPDTGDLLDEISEFREDFREYADRNRDREEIRRAESVHVLIALGIIGGFATFAATGQFPQAIDNILLQIFVGVSILFLMSKLATITLRIRFDWERLYWIDSSILPFSHSISIFGLVFLIVGQYAITISDLPSQESIPIILGIIGGIAFTGMMMYAGKVSVRRFVNVQQDTQEKFNTVIRDLQDYGIIEPQKSGELKDRLENLIIQHEDVGALDYFLAVEGNQTPGELDKSEIRRFSNILDRMEIKINNETIGYEDVQMLDRYIRLMEEE